MEKEKLLEQKKSEFRRMLASLGVVFDLKQPIPVTVRRIIQIVPTKTSIYRTARGLGSINEALKEKAKEEVYVYLFDRFKQIFNSKDTLSQESYKEWFETTCIELSDKFNAAINGNKKTEPVRYLTLGHAQKWVSMCMKYFYCFDLIDFNYDYCYCPIDNIIEEVALGIQAKSGKPRYLAGLNRTPRWSKINNIRDLRNIYLDIQSIIVENQLNCTPLEFDVLNWQ